MNALSGEPHRARPIVVSRYGPAGFVAALGNILVVEFVIWFFLPWMLYLAFLMVWPVLAVDLVLSVFLATRPGMLGQIGRGMLIGCLSAPLSLVVFSLAYLAGRAIGAI